LAVVEEAEEQVQPQLLTQFYAMEEVEVEAVLLSLV
jgi:hypothetical protein